MHPDPDGVGATLGVEEEFHLVDPMTGRLRPAIEEILAAADAGAGLTPELVTSTVETATPVCRSLAEIRATLGTTRRAVTAAAARVGLAAVAAGTVPGPGGSRPTREDIHPGDRYGAMAEAYARLAWEQTVCAVQVQVGVPDRDLAVRLLPRIQPWLPVLLALSVSSPFYGDADTGYSSFRTTLWSRWPTAGAPEPFADAAAYDEAARVLVATGTIADPGMIYYDVRPSARYPTVEIRIADACPVLDDAVLFAGLGRALVMAAARDEAARRPVPAVRHELLRASVWRAARSGTEGTLIDPLAGRAVPAAERVAALLAYTRPVLDDLGETADVVELLAARTARGSSAFRQRMAYARRAEPRDVIDQLIAETAG